MKVLSINKYLFPKGGDAVSTIETGKLLEEKGHEVYFWGMKHPANPAYPYSEYFVENIDYDSELSIKNKVCSWQKILDSLKSINKQRFLGKKINKKYLLLNVLLRIISESDRNLLLVIRKELWIS